MISWQNYLGQDNYFLRSEIFANKAKTFTQRRQGRAKKNKGENFASSSPPPLRLITLWQRGGVRLGAFACAFDFPFWLWLVRVGEVMPLLLVDIAPECSCHSGGIHFRLSTYGESLEAWRKPA
jgi:hypothetical protein